MTFIGTTQVDVLNAMTRMSTNTIQSRNTSHLLVNDAMHVVGELAANTIRARDASQVTAGDSLSVTGGLVVSGAATCNQTLGVT